MSGAARAARLVVADLRRLWGLSLSPTASPRARAAISSIALAVAAQLALGFSLFRSTGRDDAYITFWPAWTLVHHGALVNYSGERVEQSSSLLQTLLLAALHAASGIGIPELAWVSGIAAGACAVALAPRLLPAGSAAASAAAWIAALSAPLLYWSFSGMETPLVALLGVLLALCARSAVEGRGALGRALPAACVLLAFLLARPEAPLLALPFFAALAAWLALGAHGDAAARAAAWRVARLGVLAAALAAGLAVGRLVWFGSALPQPVIAKSAGLSRIAVSWGLAYLAQLPSLFPLYAGLVAALVLLLRGRCDLQRHGGPVAAALLAAGQLAFTVLAGGDWMEAGRFLAPAVPWVAVTCVFAAQPLSRRLRGAALGLVLVWSALCTLDVARRESTGIPIWTQARHVLASRYAEAPLYERANRVHVRDMPTSAALAEVLTRISQATGDRVQVFTGQGGMVLYDALRPLYGRVAVVDRSGLLDRRLTSSPTALLHGRNPQGLHIEFDAILARRARIHLESGLPEPDVIFDLQFSPSELDALERAGFEAVYAQSGRVEHGDARLPGWPLDARQSIFVQRRHLARLGALPLHSFAFDDAAGASPALRPAGAPGTSPLRAEP